jgi:uncharacterized RDD family membrane protein YckC
VAQDAIARTKVGFLTRAVALVIDGILIWVASQLLTAVLVGGEASRGSGISTLLGLAYFMYFWSASGGGQTLGMRALNIRVVKTTGVPLTLTDALIRYVGLIVSVVCLFLGVLWVIVDAQKQGWHDKLASTYVIGA